MKVYNVAIDGPAGAGKSTVAKMAAERLSFVYVDTGSMYRALALAFMRLGIKPGEMSRIEDALYGIDVTLSYRGGEQMVLLNGEDVTSLLRSQQVGDLASAFAPLAPVRAKLLLLQRELAGRTSVIMDGRDIGTTVLPHADLKIYLTADAKVRAERRYKELLERGSECDKEEILNGILTRDKQDMTREISPLRQAKDAVYLDASHMTVDEVVCFIVNLAKERFWP
ncbi:MAG: (d)CMP kinase [Lachnospiraceae bacterium]|nr:(d)CMP kinase [Lachnospiraceae bacterium]